MLTRLMLTAITMILFISPVFSQGEFLESGESGFGLAFHYSKISESSIRGYWRGDNTSNYGISFGYSFKGRWDFNAALSLDTDRTINLGSNIFLLKQGDFKIPFSICTEIGVIMSNDDRDMGYIAPGFVSRITLGKRNYLLLLTSISIYEINAHAGPNSTTTVGMAWFHDLKTTKIFISPAIAFSYLADSFGISLGFVFK